MRTGEVFLAAWWGAEVLTAPLRGHHHLLSPAESGERKPESGFGGFSDFRWACGQRSQCRSPAGKASRVGTAAPPALALRGPSLGVLSRSHLTHTSSSRLPRHHRPAPSWQPLRQGWVHPGSGAAAPPSEPVSGQSCPPTLRWQGRAPPGLSMEPGTHWVLLVCLLNEGSATELGLGDGGWSEMSHSLAYHGQGGGKGWVSGR